MTSKVTSNTGTTVTDEIIASVAEEAQSHPRTIERRLLGLPIKGRALARRVDEVLARRGLASSASDSPAGYERSYCEVHKKAILFVARTPHGVPVGTCWDCDRAAQHLAPESSSAA